jgi:hypothetical protein
MRVSSGKALAALGLFAVSQCIFAAEGASTAHGHSVEELAKAVQNPIANLISVPFQNNTTYEFGPQEKTQNVLNIQPVVPLSLNDDWNFITRTIIPIVSQPELFPGQDMENMESFAASGAPPPRSQNRSGVTTVCGTFATWGSVNQGIGYFRFGAHSCRFVYIG